MEKIINALVLSPEQKEAFLAAAPGVEQVSSPGQRHHCR